MVSSLFCVLSDALLALAQPTITEYQLPHGVFEPDGDYQGPDGNLWFIGGFIRRRARRSVMGPRSGGAKEGEELLNLCLAV